jgi:hypothetical protein
MTITPCLKQRVTQAWLNQKFNGDDWEQRLASYTKVEIHNSPTPVETGEPKGTMTIGHEYYDAENKRVATIFFYLRPDHTFGGSGKMTPKALLIDGVWHYV